MLLRSSSTPVVHTSQPLCIPTVLAGQVQNTPDTLAILTPGRSPLTYSRLYLHVYKMVQTLRTLGVNRHDRVALVLPNGPEMAVACLAVASGATCVPLNPAYGASDYDFFLRDAGAKALIIQENLDSPARAVAHALGLRIVDLSPQINAEAGLFTLVGKPFRLRAS